MICDVTYTEIFLFLGERSLSWWLSISSPFCFVDPLSIGSTNQPIPERSSLDECECAPADLAVRNLGLLNFWENMYRADGVDGPQEMEKN